MAGPLLCQEHKGSLRAFGDLAALAVDNLDRNRRAEQGWDFPHLYDRVAVSSNSGHNVVAKNLNELLVVLWLEQHLKCSRRKRRERLVSRRKHRERTGNVAGVNKTGGWKEPSPSSHVFLWRRDGNESMLKCLGA